MAKEFLVGILIVVTMAATAIAQNMAIYAPVLPLYQIGDFQYRPPMVDGWRQITSTASTLALVYAETVASDQINTRMQVDAEAFAVPDPAMIQDLLWLTEQGQAQQVKERGDTLVAFSKITPVESNKDVQSYALVTRVGSEDFHEIFYVALAPDKTSYLVAKMTTKEPDHRQQIYFKQFEESLASLVHKRTDSSGSDKAAPSAPASPPAGS